jgi:hypothetical protein
MHNTETEDLERVFFERFCQEKSTAILIAEPMVKTNANHFKAHKDQQISVF